MIPNGSVYDTITQTSTAQYEIRVFDEHGETLSLRSTPSDDPDVLVTGTLWEAAAALASVPERGWMHWDDGDSEQVPVKRIALEHVRNGMNKRGVKTHERALLEVIDR